jgi:hypothetical protein
MRPAFVGPEGSSMVEFDFNFLTRSLGMVGLFFICCAIIQNKPKHVLEERFGVYKGGLRSLKGSVFKKNQLVLGFSCVLLGLMLDQFSSVLARSDGRGILNNAKPLTLIVVWLLFVGALCGVLNYLCRRWSKWHFRRIITEVVTEHRWPFADNVALAVEIGELVGVARQDDDTVERYLVKLKSHLELPSEETKDRPSVRSQRLGINFK